MKTLRIGDKVKAVAFVDSFGKPVPETNDLEITNIRCFAHRSMEPYIRIEAHGIKNPFVMVEGASRFFETVTQCQYVGKEI